MKKFFEKLKSLIPTKRRLIQLYAALLTNANIKGFIQGSIYQGNSKGICAPGLNCYSCPGAVGACPLGSLQNALAASGKRTPYYVFGILLLYGIILGRTICGFLCPFGLAQDIVYKVKTPKLGKSRATKALSYVKYVILALLVIAVPVLYGLRDVPLPAFCKYICPAGTLGGAISLLANSANDAMFEMLGPLFTWKFLVFVVIAVACVFIYRAFCRFLCPLGALYGLFNRFALLGIKLDRPKCVDCGKCITTCKMDITSVGDKECISCGDCVSVCPTQAIRYSGSKIILPDNEIPEKASDEEKARIEKKRKTRTTVLKIVAAVLMTAILGGAIVYYNFIDVKPPVETGYEVGYACPEFELDLADGSGTVNIADLKGKVVVINFWGTWCSSCVHELPYFDQVASEYKESVTVVTVHTSQSYGLTEPDAYRDSYYPDTEMIFLRDKASPDNPNADYCFSMLGGTDKWPMTVILDKDGVITFNAARSMTYDELVAEVTAAME